MMTVFFLPIPHYLVFLMQYEYKVKGIRKIRVNINVAVAGVKISKRKGKRVSWNCTLLWSNHYTTKNRKESAGCVW